MLEPKTPNQHAQLRRVCSTKCHSRTVLVITALPENMISSILLFRCTAAWCRGIHPRSSTLDRVSGCSASLFSVSSSPVYEWRTSYCSFWQDKSTWFSFVRLRQFTLLDCFENLIGIFAGFLITTKRHCTEQEFKHSKEFHSVQKEIVILGGCRFTSDSNLWVFYIESGFVQLCIALPRPRPSHPLIDKSHLQSLWSSEMHKELLWRDAGTK